MASRALIARFITTWLICPRSAMMVTGSGSRAVTISTSSPMSRRSIRLASATAPFREMGLASAICLRLNASNCCVRAAARAPAAPTTPNPPPPPPRRVPRREIRQQHVAIAADHRQMVVEVVSHPAGQPADALHLLRLPQLRLELGPFRLRPLALRDVVEERNRGRPAVVFERRPRYFHG